jgi:peptidyl-prolyl cis-trans isomerase SurA
MRKFLIPFSCLLCACSLQAQTLVTIGPEKVSVAEFLSIYNKGDRVQMGDKAIDLRNYLDLYIHFRLKVLDARAQGMDKSQQFRDELKGYRDRLASHYLLEREVSEKLVNEAYERSLKILNVSHILIMCPSDAPAADTLKAYERISLIRNKAAGGTPFGELAATYSEEPGSAQRKGYIGDFSAFQMVYPFETAAYKTVPGTVSQVVRTRFGYHLIKVNSVRSNPGRVEADQILIPASGEAGDSTERAKAFEVHRLVTRGADFAAMAKQFPAQRNAGAAVDIVPGQSDQVLETAAFALENPGDISQPVKTPQGWHILRLIRREPIPAFNVVKDKYRQRVAADERSVLGQDAFISRLKKQYHFKEMEWLTNDPALLKAKMAAEDASTNDVLFTINNENVVLSDFLKFVVSKNDQGQDTQVLYRQFVREKLTAIEDQLLEQKYPDFRYLVEEYRSGILLFNISEQKLWTPAQADSVGLKKFYKEHISDYGWKERAEARIYIASSAEQLKKINDMLNEKKSDQQIAAAINSSSPMDLVINSGVYERGRHLFVDRAKWQANSDSEITVGNAFALVRISKIVPSTAKSFAEVEADVIADYQEYLEDQWLKGLKEKYPVEINQVELKKINR